MKMNKQKIIIVSRSFYPENSPRSLRTTELVKEFARQGHEVTLLTLKNDQHHESFEAEHGVTIKDFGPLKFSPVELDGSSGFTRIIKRVLRRGLLQLFEYPDIELMYRVKKALQKESGYDLLISIAVPYPIHWGVAWARREENPIAETWVADCGDPYYGLENDSFNKLFYFAWVEKWFCRKADFITIPFEGGESAYFEEFHSKIKVIPQGLSFPLEINGEQYSNNENETVTFAYFGNIQSYLHYAEPFLEKLNTVEKDFKFIVYTQNKELFREKLDHQTLKKCELNSYVEREKLLSRLSSVDFLIHFPYRKDSQKSLKLIDYNFLRKPILEYKNDHFSDEVFREFLEFNFENKRDFEDYEKYKIENVSASFIELLQNNRHLVASH